MPLYRHVKNLRRSAIIRRIVRGVALLNSIKS